MPSEWKNSSTSSPSGAAPDTPTRNLPPSRCFTLEKTSRSAIRSSSRSSAGTGFPSRRRRLARPPTPIAQSPIARFAPPSRSISPSTFAWIFSYTRGTAGRIVGRTDASASGTRAASEQKASVEP